MDESGAPRIVVVYADEAAKPRASQVAARLQAPLRHIDARNSDKHDGSGSLSHLYPEENLVYLEIGEADSLLSWDTPKSGSLRISFTDGANGYRRRRVSPRSDTLARAIGLSRRMTRAAIANWSVLDATAGMCTDTWAMAAYGCRVMAFERSGWLQVLQTDALRQAIAQPDARECASRISLINADAGDWLSNLVNHCGQETYRRQTDRLFTEPPAHPAYLSSAPDVIYIDPMYPQRKKSAAVKKNMQTLQRLIGPDQDSKELLDAAMAAATKLSIKRVVVKRPANSESLENSSGIKPTHNHESKNTRYDVYLFS